MKRRSFIKSSAQVSLGFVGLQSFLFSCSTKRGSSELIRESILSKGYGPLLEDPDGILKLPQGFSYRIISKQGDKMSDGYVVPGLADGMATFESADGKVIIIRNHEVSSGDIENGPFGNNLELLSESDIVKLYDYGNGEEPCVGGTTTIIYDPKSGEIEKEYLSLAGTIRNCAGGKTPWNSWISCEEDVSTTIGKLEKYHGYTFEVPAQTESTLFDPKPIKAMGRFNHEAVAVDPKTGIVYQTEDRHDSLIYRYIPNEFGKLHDGGKLQILAIKDQKSFSTRNWKGDANTIERNKAYQVEWLDIDNIDSEKDDLRIRGYEKGAAMFARGEGMWFGENEFFFACTNGGRKNYGQIFKYTPSPYEGQSNENDQPGKLELFIESDNSDILESCDNLTVASNGDLIICEDQETPRIIGVSPDGKIYHLAKNVGYASEFAGATFSPDGTTLFVNIQKPGLTLAITGPWGKRETA